MSGLLDNPASVMQRLAEIENDLAERQNRYEAAAETWFKLQAQLRADETRAYLTATGSPAEKRIAGLDALGSRGGEEQAAYESLRSAVKVLEARATIGMSILKSQGRAS